MPWTIMRMSFGNEVVNVITCADSLPATNDSWVSMRIVFGAMFTSKNFESAALRGARAWDELREVWLGRALPRGRRFYEPLDAGYERHIAERLARWRARRDARDRGDES